MDLALVIPREYTDFDHMVRFQNALAHLDPGLEPGPRAALYLVTGHEGVWSLVRPLFGRDEFQYGEVLGVGEPVVDTLIMMAAALYQDDQDSSVGVQFGQLWSVLGKDERQLVFNAINYYEELTN